MKRAIVAIAAGMSFAGGAVSQPAPPRPYEPGAFWRGAPQSPHERIRFLQDRIRSGVANGSLSRAEARRVDGQLDATREWARRNQYYEGGRLDPGRAAEFQQRLDRISGEIHWMKRNGR